MLRSALLIALSTASPALAGGWHCQRPDGTEYVCHVCMRGHWPTGEEHRCSAAEERAQSRRYARQWRRMH